MLRRTRAAVIIAAAVAAVTVGVPSQAAAPYEHEADDYVTEVGPQQECGIAYVDISLVAPPKGWQSSDGPWRYVYTGPLKSYGSSGRTIDAASYKKDSSLYPEGHVGTLSLYFGNQEMFSGTPTAFVRFLGGKAPFTIEPDAKICTLVSRVKTSVKKKPTTTRPGSIVVRTKTVTGPPTVGPAEVTLTHAGVRTVRHVRLTGSRTVLKLPRLAAGTWKVTTKFLTNATFSTAATTYRSAHIHVRK